jgi:manganese-dependent inorganic pyrophosphatase
VILNSPTTTDRDRRVVEYLENRIDVDHEEFGREMFEAGSDVSEATADEIVTRDAKEYELPSGDTISIAQIETVGSRVLERAGELRDAIEEVRRRNGYLLAALMVTDILAGDTELIACGDQASIERAFGEPEDDAGTFKLPGVMSRKKQVAPRVLGAI